MNCPTCGSALEAGSRFCGTCGADVSNLTMTSSNAGAMAMPARDYGGFWIRVVAYIIDGIILGVVGVVLVLIFGTEGSGQAISNLISFVIGLLYYGYFWSSERQATPGMMAMGLRVIGEDGNRISIGRAIGRYFALLLSFIILFIGVIMVAFDSRKQGLHDKIVKTLVVKRS